MHSSSTIVAACARHAQRLASAKHALSCAFLCAILQACRVAHPSTDASIARSTDPRPPGPWLLGVAPDAHALSSASELSGALGACVRRANEGLSPTLAAAVDTMGYGQLTEDACRLSLATELRDPSLCTSIALPSVSRACVTRVAIALQNYTLCPDALDEPGPDSLCVALATRAPSRCAGAGPTEATRCRAIAEHDVARCQGLPTPLQPRCVRDVQALASALPLMRGPHPEPGRMSLHIEWVNSTDPALDLQADGFDRGVFATPDRGLMLVDPRRRWPSPTAYVMAQQRVAVGMHWTLGAQRDGIVKSLRVVLADGRVIESVVGQDAGAVRYQHASLEPGHEVHASYEARGVVQGRPVRITGELHTFVRDSVSERHAREGVERPRDRDAGTEL
ncbi:MAG: hypothetical protein Q8Q09_25535 [Deltaproteobacteria bacterium]|nr:hypothetical protein [Deltaproteobacteria bacterium]